MDDNRVSCLEGGSCIPIFACTNMFYEYFHKVNTITFFGNNVCLFSTFFFFFWIPLVLLCLSSNTTTHVYLSSNPTSQYNKLHTQQSKHCSNCWRYHAHELSILSKQIYGFWCRFQSSYWLKDRAIVANKDCGFAATMYKLHVFDWQSIGLKHLEYYSNIHMFPLKGSEWVTQSYSSHLSQMLKSTSLQK